MSDDVTPKMLITCQRCSASFSVPLPQPEIANGLRTSSMTAAHEKPIRCTGCGQGFRLVLVQIQAGWQAQAVDDAELAPLEESRIVTAGAMPRLELLR